MNSSLTATNPNTPAEAQVVKTNGTREFVRPLANIRETADGYLLEVEMPGVNKDGLEVTVEAGELRILGRRAESTTLGKLLYRESRARDYRRVFELDPAIDTAKISARIEGGVARFDLPKSDRVKPRKIEVAG